MSFQVRFLVEFKKAIFQNGISTFLFICTIILPFLDFFGPIFTKSKEGVYSAEFMFRSLYVGWMSDVHHMAGHDEVPYESFIPSSYKLFLNLSYIFLILSLVFASILFLYSVIVFPQEQITNRFKQVRRMFFFVCIIIFLLPTAFLFLVASSPSTYSQADWSSPTLLNPLIILDLSVGILCLLFVFYNITKKEKLFKQLEGPHSIFKRFLLAPQKVLSDSLGVNQRPRQPTKMERLGLSLKNGLGVPVNTAAEVLQTSSNIDIPRKIKHLFQKWEENDSLILRGGVFFIEKTPAPTSYCQLCGGGSIESEIYFQCCTCEQYVCSPHFTQLTSVGKPTCSNCDGKLYYFPFTCQGCQLDFNSRSEINGEPEFCPLCGHSLPSQELLINTHFSPPPKIQENPHNNRDNEKNKDKL